MGLSKHTVLQFSHFRALATITGHASLLAQTIYTGVDTWNRDNKRNSNNINPWGREGEREGGGRSLPNLWYCDCSSWKKIYAVLSTHTLCRPTKQYPLIATHSRPKLQSLTTTLSCPAVASSLPHIENSITHTAPWSAIRNILDLHTYTHTCACAPYTCTLILSFTLIHNHTHTHTYMCPDTCTHSYSPSN